MARAIWAARSQLLAKLRPYAAQDAPLSVRGLAPPALLPEICAHLRAYDPSELRMLLAAYSSHDRDDRSLAVVPSNPLNLQSGGSSSSTKPASDGPGPVQLPAEKLAKDAASSRFVDVLVGLLVGGSRLGTTAQLLEASSAIARHASCDCRAATDFWDLFAERVARLSASNALEAEEMLRTFEACAIWQSRLAASDPARAGRRGGTLGHMLRSVGGRLADPERLGQLELSEVVALARYAARLGEPQLRLAAAIGHRVGGEEADELGPQDLVDLIGAAGRLGGRLHMMTRALSDHLEPQVAQLPASSLVVLCSHLGALEMFPQRLAIALEGALQEAVPSLSDAELLRLLRAGGRLRWRVPAVLEPMLERIRQQDYLDALTGADLGTVLYELYRLDLWQPDLLEAICLRLGPGSSHLIPRKTAANSLLALTYFAHADPELYRRLLNELMRTQDVPQQAIFQLKTFEMALRVGHIAFEPEALGQMTVRWLFAIRKAKTPPEARSESALADDISAVATGIAWKHEAEVEVGPYLLDFAGVLEGDEEEHPQWDDRKPGRSLQRTCVALEADGPSHFYRPHGRPWHWTSTSKLRHRLLNAARIKVAHVPYYDWMQLDTLEEKEAYLSQLLLRTQSTYRRPARVPEAAPAAVRAARAGHDNLDAQAPM